MSQIFELNGRSIASLQKLNWLPVLLARISLGTVFTLSGWGKIHNLPKVTEFFTDLGIPFPEFNAVFVGFTEFGCGILILIGLLTRLASIPLIITMIVAIAVAKRSEITGITDILGFEESIYVVIFIWLIFDGAGKISLDNIVCHKRIKFCQNS